MTSTGLSQPENGDGCIAMSAAEGCTVGHALKGPVDLAVSPDGRSVYAAAASSRHDREPAQRPLQAAR